MITDPVLFRSCMMVTGMIFFVLLYCLLLLIDVECEEASAKECCRKLNGMVVIKVVVYSMIPMLLLLNGQFFVTFLSFPMLCWLVYEIYTVPRSHKGVYDHFEIADSTVLRKYVKRCETQLVYHMLFFFIYLYKYLNAHLDEKVEFQEILEEHFPAADEF